MHVCASPFRGINNRQALVKTYRASSCSCNVSTIHTTRGSGGPSRASSNQTNRPAREAKSHAQTKWSEPNLKRWLADQGVRVEKYGHSGAKSIKQLLNELTIGDSVLTVDSDGHPLRIVQVAKATVQHGTRTNYVLVETHQKLESGVMRVRYKTLAEKMQPGESSWVGTQRGIMEELEECLKKCEDFPSSTMGGRTLGDRDVCIFGGKTHEEEEARRAWADKHIVLVNTHPPTVEYNESSSYPDLM